MPYFLEFYASYVFHSHFTFYIMCNILFHVSSMLCFPTSRHPVMVVVLSYINDGTFMIIFWIIYLQCLHLMLSCLHARLWLSCSHFMTSCLCLHAYLIIACLHVMILMFTKVTHFTCIYLFLSLGAPISPLIDSFHDLSSIYLCFHDISISTLFSLIGATLGAPCFLFHMLSRSHLTMMLHVYHMMLSLHSYMLMWFYMIVCFLLSNSCIYYMQPVGWGI